MLILIISIASILTFMITILIFFKIMGNRVKNSFKIGNYKITIRNVNKTEREILDKNFDRMCEEV